VKIKWFKLYFITKLTLSICCWFSPWYVRLDT